MSAISITGLEPELEDWLSRRASTHGVSLEEEVAAILRRERAREAPPEAHAAGTRSHRYPAPMKLPPGAPNSLDLIREDRDSR